MRKFLVGTLTILVCAIVALQYDGGERLENKMTVMDVRSRSPEGHETTSEARHHSAKVEVEHEESAPKQTASGGNLTSAAITAACFHNRVMFQPVFCSKILEIAAKCFDVGSSRWAARNWSLVHVGSRDSWIKLSEWNDLFGGANSVGGSKSVAKALRQHTQKGLPEVCGGCCECASLGEQRVYTGMSYHLTLLEAPFQGEQSAPADHPFWARGHRLVRLPTNALGECPATVVEAVVLEMGQSSSSDILTLDTWKCDAALVRRLILEGPQRPLLIDFSAAADTSYQSLVEQLFAFGYHCFYMTTKPEHKRFRGIRQPQYPIAIQLTGCWRGIYDSFRHDRYRITCGLMSDVTTQSVLTAFTRMAHKGTHAGCSIPSRNARMQRLDAFLTQS